MEKQADKVKKLESPKVHVERVDGDMRSEKDYQFKEGMFQRYRYNLEERRK